MKTAQKGFTLIELMIVVAIIGILAAIALPAYQDYTVKSQVGGAYSEVSSLKSAFEIAKNEGKTPSISRADAGFIGQEGDSGQYCTITVSATAITCTMKNGNADKFNTKTLTLTRTGEGVWSCATSVDAKFRPGSCTAAT